MTDVEDDLRELKARRWRQKANDTEEWAYEFVVERPRLLVVRWAPK
jgi:hypothetical protein